MEKGGQTANADFSLWAMLKQTDNKVYAMLVAGVLVFIMGAVLSGIELAFIGYPVSVVGFAMVFYAGFQFRRQWGPRSLATFTVLTASPRTYAKKTIATTEVSG